MNFIEPLAWFVFFILSATVHEAAHAWAAKLGGDLTAYHGGQVSLNPWPHIKREPVGMVVMPLISSFVFGWPFGYASAPYDVSWAYNRPRRAALMALAGPAANLLIVLFCAFAIRIGILSGFFSAPFSVGFRHIVDPAYNGSWTGLTVVISMLFTLNLIMLVINLLPLPPLDGSSIITLFLSDDLARKFRTLTSNPAFGLVEFLIAWQLIDPIFEIAFLGIINILYWGSIYG